MSAKGRLIVSGGTIHGLGHQTEERRKGTNVAFLCLWPWSSAMCAGSLTLLPHQLPSLPILMDYFLKAPGKINSSFLRLLSVDHFVATINMKSFFLFCGLW